MLKVFAFSRNLIIGRNFGQFATDYKSPAIDSAHLFFRKALPKMSDNCNNADNSSATIKKSGKIVLTKEERKQQLKQKRQARKAEKQVGFSNAMLEQTEYYFENGFRKVYPYYFGWNTTAKERWFGMKLVDLYTKEFQRAIINQSVAHLIETGKIRVNGVIKSPDYVIKNGDRLSHIKHRHEIPVLADKIKVIYEDDDYVVVDKPCSIPIHPCGKFRYNTLSIILIKEMGYKNIRTIYRLDRLTSGLVILGKNLKATLLIDQHIKDRTAKKTYLCRVVGDFPNEKITVDKPIDCCSPKLGMHWINEQNGKEATTEFEKVSFNGKTSLVKCYPKTGRTHQIRIHLQYLGFPIINDPLYNQPIIWGPNNGKDAVYPLTKEEMENNFLKIHSYEAWIINQEQNENIEQEETTTTTAKVASAKNENETVEEIPIEEDKTSNAKRRNSDSNEEKINAEATKKQKTASEDEIKDEKETKNEGIVEKSSNVCLAENTENKETASDNLKQFDKSRLEIDPDCFECKNEYRDPNREEVIMFLHAYSYKFEDLSFQTECPKWAQDDYEG